MVFAVMVVGHLRPSTLCDFGFRLCYFAVLCQLRVFNLRGPSSGWSSGIVFAVMVVGPLRPFNHFVAFVSRCVILLCCAASVIVEFWTK